VSIADNLHRIQAEMAAACAQAGRDSKGVRLMAVSKVQPVEAIQEAYAAGQRLFGENRVQEVQGKQPLLAGLPGLEMHLIGPLQNNKTGRAAELFQAVDTLDSLRTAQRLHDAALKLGKVMPVLIEVKLSPEETKHGVAPEGLGTLLDALQPMSALHVRGLMTVPPWSEEAESARPTFRRLRELRDLHAARHPGLIELSMGMSNDFRVAIEEGSTTVRIGTALFGARHSS
jgi:PLP dependent protein